MSYSNFVPESRYSGWMQGNITTDNDDDNCITQSPSHTGFSLSNNTMMLSFHNVAHILSLISQFDSKVCVYHLLIICLGA